MKEKVKEVQDYFKNKLLTGDFEIKVVREHYCEIMIDGEYGFTVWTGNFVDIPHTTRLWKMEYNFIDIEFTNTEALQLNSILKTPVTEYRKNTLIAQKKAELEKLISETE